MIDLNLSYQQKQTKTKYVQLQPGQQVRRSIFISCLSLIGYNILKKDLQIVQIELQFGPASVLKQLIKIKHV